MARKTRGEIPAGVYHVWRRTNGPIPMFHDDFDRTAFCNRLSGSLRKHGVTCVSFVLMTTHFHLIVRVDDNVLSATVRDFFGPYAQAFNRRHRRYGHLRAEPFKLRPIYGDIELRIAARYVAMNPVEANMCELPQDWPWSSYPGTAGYDRRFPFVDDSLLVRSIHPDVSIAQQILREIIAPRNVKGTIPLTYVA